MQKRYRKWLWLVLALLVVLGGIGGLVHQRLASTSHKTVKVGLVGTDSLPVWKNVVSRLKKEGITLKFVIFNDYVQPDVALKDGKIDLHSTYQTGRRLRFPTSQPPSGAGSTSCNRRA